MKQWCQRFLNIKEKKVYDIIIIIYFKTTNKIANFFK